MDKNEQKALSDIKEFGCHILHVTEDEENPRFSYSIGIQKITNHPEIIITGLRFEHSHQIIMEYTNLIREGKMFQLNIYYDNFLENFDVIFKRVNKKFYKEYFGWARWLYNGNDFEAFQLIYPNSDGIWPWDESATNEFKWFLPNLYE